MFATKRSISSRFGWNWNTMLWNLNGWLICLKLLTILLMLSVVCVCTLGKCLLISVHFFLICMMKSRLTSHSTTKKVKLGEERERERDLMASKIMCCFIFLMACVHVENLGNVSVMISDQSWMILVDVMILYLLLLGCCRQYSGWDWQFFFGNIHITGRSKNC